MPSIFQKCTRLHALLLWLLLIWSFSLKASHIVGGEITYQCLPANSYNIQLRLFRDCSGNTAQMPTSAIIEVRSGAGILLTSLATTRSPLTFLNISRPACGTLSPNFCVQTATFKVSNVSLPYSSSGYIFYYYNCCRNANIDNINSPSSQGFLICTKMYPHNGCDNSPYFAHNPPLVVPFNAPLSIDASAVDSDGDSLYYELCSPLNNTSTSPPFDTIVFVSGNNSKYPITSNPAFDIDHQTGMLNGTITQIGNYLVAICIKEYRNDTLIGMVQRDYQFNAINAWTVFASVPASNMVLPHCRGSADGSLTVATVGGVPPLQYLWSTGDTTPTALNLAAGLYSVVVTDTNGCSDTAVVNLPEPAALGLTVVRQLPASCSGTADGSATVTATGGVAPYAAVWEDGTSGFTDSALAIGIHQIFVSDSLGCKDTLAVTIVPQSSLAIQLDSLSHPSCAGAMDGYFNISFTGGVPPYNYSWSDGATSLQRTGMAAGRVTLYLSDNAGCSDSLRISLVDPPVLNITLDSLKHVNCYGAGNGSIYISASGGTAPYSYQWSSGATTSDLPATGPGNIQLTITDSHGCSTSANYVVQGPAPFNVDTSAVVEATCRYSHDGTINLGISGGRIPYNVSWNNGSTGQTVTGLSVGSYTYTITDSAGCQLSGSVHISSPNAVVASVSSFGSVSCPGSTDGWANVMATGGIPPYNYYWLGTGSSDSVNIHLIAGNNYVVISDSRACSDTLNVVIPSPDTLKIKLDSIKDVSCFGFNDGFIKSRITGGSPPYQLNWSNGQQSTVASNLLQGTYVLNVVDSRGCSASRSFVVNEPTLFDPGIDSVVYTSCHSSADGEIFVKMKGGTPPYTLSCPPATAVGNSLLNVPMGWQQIMATDAHGCEKLLRVFIGKKDPLRFTGIIVTPPTCYNTNDGEAEALVLGGQPPYIFNWSIGKSGRQVSGFIPGWHDVAVIDADNCSWDTSFYVPPTPKAQLAISETPATCFDLADASLTVEVSGDKEPYTVLVDSLPLDANNGHFKTGIHIITTIDRNGCSLQEQYNIHSRMEHIIFFPNAFSPNNDGLNDFFELKAAEECFPHPSLTVFDRWGKIIFNTHNPFHEAWDGKVGGELVKPDVYIYKFESDYYHAHGYLSLLD